MSRQEILSMRYGEMIDMISCFAIYHGANPKKKKLTNLEDIWKLR